MMRSLDSACDPDYRIYPAKSMFFVFVRACTVKSQRPLCCQFIDVII